jgi:hypothetical protein
MAKKEQKPKNCKTCSKQTGCAWKVHFEGKQNTCPDYVVE